MSEDFIHLALHSSRAILQYMLESLIFSMYVSQEVFGTLGQIQDCFQIDDFGTGIGNGRKAVRQQLQIAQITDDTFRSNVSHDFIVLIHSFLYSVSIYTPIIPIGTSAALGL